MSKTALVVDDSKSARFALRKYLENHGYKVDAVEGAGAAYDFLKTRLPSIIFLDHIMPDVDGFEALQHIKSDPRTSDVPTVICSSNEGAAFNESARNKGAAAVLQKPPSPQQLAQVLAAVQALEQTEAEAEAAEASDLAAAASPAETPARPPVVEAPRPASAKVTNIREPEVAIEQAVMKAVRHAMQAPAEPPRVAPPPAPDLAATGRFNPNATGSFTSGGLREQIDERIRKVTQDLFVQVAALRADMTALEERPLESEDTRRDLTALREDLRAVEDSFGQQLDELRQRIESGFAEQERKLEQLAQSAREAAAEEAHNAAERAVMAAATRVSDQLAQSILRAFNGPDQQRRSG
jgi:CheY-like chemotaxis protein